MRKRVVKNRTRILCDYVKERRDAFKKIGIIEKNTWKYWKLVE